MGRDPLHDYRCRCIYLITIGKAAGCPDFSQVGGAQDSPVVELSPVGKIIEDQIRKFPFLCTSLRILQYVVMPDHVHFAIFARDYLPYTIDWFIEKTIAKCTQRIKGTHPTVSEVFIPDFQDRIMRPCHSPESIIKYIRDNPSRWLRRQLEADYFLRLNNIEIQGSPWQAVGNLQLLENPFKAPVVIHRADSEMLKANKRRRWKHLAENGGVLVSPFISAQEKEIRRQCEQLNGKVILITSSPFRETENPTAHSNYSLPGQPDICDRPLNPDGRGFNLDALDLDLCVRGRLLILAPVTPLTPCRQTFLHLNTIAESIVLPRPT